MIFKLNCIAFFIIFDFNKSFGFITRLPCKYHANFTINHNKYYAVTENEAQSSVSERDCIFSCVTKDSCISFNYNEETLECILISSNGGTLEDRIGWKYAATDVSDDTKIGPVCESLNPCPLEKCKDICVEPFYQCEPDCGDIAGEYGGSVITKDENGQLTGDWSGDRVNFFGKINSDCTGYLNFPDDAIYQFLYLAKTCEIDFVTAGVWQKVACG